jgi:uncharacterized membrane protein YesL
MGRVFRPEHPLMRGLSRLFDLILLNAAFLASCLPVFTIGASFSALYAVLFQMRNHSEERVLRAFLSAFKDNFKKGIALGAVALFLGVLLAVNVIVLANRGQTGFGGVFLIILTVAAMLYAMALVYVFALQARFENTVRNTLTNSILMSVRHFPKTICLGLIAFLPIAVTLCYPRAVYIAVPLYLLTGFSLGGFFSVRILDPIFKQYARSDCEVKADADIRE